MTKTIGWELYRSLLGVLQEGSLSAAARALGITQPTVGRHIDALEHALKLTLFIRSQGGLVPTEAALALRAYAEEMANTAATLERVAASQGDGVQGTVRVTASDIIGVEVLPAIIRRLQQDYPALVIELVLSNQPQDLLQREADIAVRMFRPRQSQLVAQRIGAVNLGLHAHHDYLARRGRPTQLTDLADHTLIGFDTVTAFIRQTLKQFPSGFERERYALRTDSDLAHLALIRAGAGIGICQVPLADRDSHLEAVLPRQLTFPLDIWLTMHEDLRQSPPIRATFDALAAGLQQYLASAATPQ